MTTRIRFCLKTAIFSSGLAYRPHAFWENGHRKRIFSKTLPRVNAGHSFKCGRMKTEVFEYDDVIHTTSIMHTLWGVLSYFHCLVFSYGRAKTIRIRFVWTRIFLKTEEKKSAWFSKKKRIRADRARVSNANDFENIKNYAKKGVNVLNQLKRTF